MEGEKETLNSHRNSLSSTWPQLSPQMTAPQKWCLVLDIRPPTKSSPIKRRLFHALVQHDGEVCRTYSTIVVCRRYLLLLERVRTAARGSLASQNYVFEPIQTYPTPNSSSNLTLHPFIFLRYLFFFFFTMTTERANRDFSGGVAEPTTAYDKGSLGKRWHPPVLLPSGPTSIRRWISNQALFNRTLFQNSLSNVRWELHQYTDVQGPGLKAMSTHVMTVCVDRIRIAYEERET